jgi:hypothetical protein
MTALRHFTRMIRVYPLVRFKKRFRPRVSVCNVIERGSNKHFQLLNPKRSRNSVVMILSLDQEDVYVYIYVNNIGRIMIPKIKALVVQQKVGSFDRVSFSPCT